VGYEVAQALGAPHEVFIVRKLGVPGNEELAMGAVASGGAVAVNKEVVRALDLREEQVLELASAEAAELAWRERRYRGNRPSPDLRDRIALVVDDGLATGSTMRAALMALRALGPARIVVAVPVAPADTRDEIAAQVDEMVCLATPESFYGVGQFYEDFSQVSDEEVRAYLAVGHAPAEPPTAPGA
jgi:putative phosphoribosyl transferase